MTAFNESFLAQTNTNTDSKTTGFMCAHRNDITIPGYIDRVLELCLTTNVVEKLGLSFKDLFQMDTWMFQKIREALEAHKPVEDAVLNNIQKEHEKLLKK